MLIFSTESKMPFILGGQNSLCAKSNHSVGFCIGLAGPDFHRRGKRAFDHWPNVCTDRAGVLAITRRTRI